LRPDEFKTLAINPGSTSTKVAVYANETCQFRKDIRHSDAELQQFRGCPVLEQQNFRLGAIEEALNEVKFEIATLSAVAGRGGLLPPLESGTYVVDDEMLKQLHLAQRGEHASNLGAILAHNIGQKAGVPAYIVDPVSVDELTEHARLSGSALLERQCLSHALNSKAVAKRYARERGEKYESLRLIVAHLGSGISVSAHASGRMIDVTNSREEGAFSTERAGGVPCMQLVDLCFAGKYTRAQVEDLLFRNGGLYSYLGTRDLAEVERRVQSGDARARNAFRAMIYQIAKEIGSMAAVLRGHIDALLLTGGMAHSQGLVTELSRYTSWIAPIAVYPGDDELQALVDGVLRVLRGEEKPRVLEQAQMSSGD
jgi:butyrate kinase